MTSELKRFSASHLLELVVNNSYVSAKHTHACVSALVASMRNSLETLQAEVERDGEELPEDVTSLLGCLRVFYLVQCVDVNILRDGKVFSF